MTKRYLSVILVLIMAFGVLACGCSGEKREVVRLTLSTEDSEAILAAAGIMLPDAEVAPGAGSTIKWFCWYDTLHNYSDAEIVNTGYWTFSNKYKGEIHWIETTWAERYNDLANLVLGGDPPDFFPSGSDCNDTFPTYCIKGMFAPVDDYIDYNDPLWAGVKPFVDKYFTLAGKHFVICTENSFESVVPYNRRVIEEWGFDDPAELYANDEWTWDKFYEMCVDFSDPDFDRYALDGWAYSGAIMECAGTTVVALNPETGRFESNLDDPRLERAADLLYNLAKNQCIYPVWNYNFNTRNGTDNEGAGVKEGLTLFYIRGPWAFTGPVEEMSHNWGDIPANELMFVPLPRDSEGDGKYYIQAMATGYCMIKGAGNPEGVALFASCERFKKLDPTVVDIDRRQLEDKYLWTREMLEMYDHCKLLAQSGETATIYYGNGLGDNLWMTAEQIKCSSRQSNAVSWAQAKESNIDKFEFYIEELNTSIEKYEQDNGADFG